MPDLQKELEIALKAARVGAKVVLGNFGKSKDSLVKGNSKGLVTATDLAAEKAILDVLQNESDYLVLSEESASKIEMKGPVWVVDPLDGTNNFARSLPFFAVSVGLMDGNDSLVGVIIDVVGQKEYYAVKGGGAFCNDEKIIQPKFDSEYIPMLFLNHGYAEIDRAKFKELSKRLASDFNILKLGTTALELCYIANGSVDGFICSGDELWDFAAGIVIAQEAGCVFTDWKGNPWDGTNSHLLIARLEIHNELVKRIQNLLTINL
jgi:myo-inositol-1(or 4)-monophosphatase